MFAIWRGGKNFSNGVADEFWVRPVKMKPTTASQRCLLSRFERILDAAETQRAWKIFSGGWRTEAFGGLLCLRTQVNCRSDLALFASRSRGEGDDDN